MANSDELSGNWLENDEDDMGTDETKGEERMVVNPTYVRERIDHALEILSDFKNRRNKSKSRAEIIEELSRDLSEYYGYLQELSDLFLELFSPSECVEFMDASDKPRPLVIRTNTIKTTRKDLMDALSKRGVAVEAIEWSKVAIKVTESTVPIGATPEYLAGHYILQSAASLNPVMALDPQPGERILDMSSAPGGKTSYVAQLMKNSGTVMANDLKVQRQKATVANLHRLGVKNAIVCCMDGRKVPGIMKGFDRVLLDAPCSGLGVIARDQTVKLQRTLKDIQRNAHLQKELLCAAVDAVDHKSVTGGIVVYSTCSVSTEENEQVVEYILHKRHVRLIDTGLEVGRPGYTRYQERRFHPSMTLTKRFYPHVHNMDGFFVAKFKKYASGIKTDESNMKDEAAEVEEYDEVEEEEEGDPDDNINMMVVDSKEVSHMNNKTKDETIEMEIDNQKSKSKSKSNISKGKGDHIPANKNKATKIPQNTSVAVGEVAPMEENNNVTAAILSSKKKKTGATTTSTISIPAAAATSVPTMSTTNKDVKMNGKGGETSKGKTTEITNKRKELEVSNSSTTTTSSSNLQGPKSNTTEIISSLIPPVTNNKKKTKTKTTQNDQSTEQNNNSNKNSKNTNIVANKSLSSSSQSNQGSSTSTNVVANKNNNNSSNSNETSTSIPKSPPTQSQDKSQSKMIIQSSSVISSKASTSTEATDASNVKKLSKKRSNSSNNSSIKELVNTLESLTSTSTSTKLEPDVTQVTSSLTLAGGDEKVSKKKAKKDITESSSSSTTMDITTTTPNQNSTNKRINQNEMGTKPITTAATKPTTAALISSSAPPVLSSPISSTSSSVRMMMTQQSLKIPGNKVIKKKSIKSLREQLKQSKSGSGE